MAKVRVSDLAKQMGVSDKDLLFKLQSLGVQVENASAAIDHEVIVAILSGKKLATRPRNVIMREDKPKQEKKREVVRPPRPIIAPPKRESRAAAPEPEPASPQAPVIIPEFLEAAEAEAAEQERAAKERSQPKRTKAAPAAPAPDAEAPQQAEQPAAVSEAADASPDVPEPTSAPEREQAPDAPATPEPAEERPAAAAQAPSAAARRTGPTGPRAREVHAPRPNYANRPRVAIPQTPDPAAARPAPGQQRPGARPGFGQGAPMQGRTSSDRPGMGGAGMRPRPAGPGMGTRPAPGGARPAGGRSVPGMPPPPAMPGAATVRRKKVESGDDRPEKKKTTGKRGKRTTGVSEDSNEFLTKGPFSAAAVLDDDTTGEFTPQTAEEEAEARRQVSSRRDARKQAAPVSGRVLEFKRPTGKVTLTEGVTVKDLADKLGVKANDLIRHLMMKRGMMLSINAPLSAEVALEISRELGIDAEVVSFETSVELDALEKNATTEGGGGVEPRAPVITVMGHVDHGKTSLLDAIRETNVAEGEAGGITQHIGAYQVEKRGRRIVFLDTPGHEAFTMMRARGAKATDIVVLVVAADDGVMPQTREAINHAKAANVPMIVAINKIDKPNANVERVRRELSEAGVLVEQWGGDVVSVEVSAIKRTGIDDVLEMILLTADLLELRATPALPARGVVLEARRDAGRGMMATVLIQDGTLKIGDDLICGLVTGRVRAMMDDRGNRLKEAAPSTPVSVMGFDDLPNAGDSLIVVDEEAKARAIVELRQEKARDAAMIKAPRASLDQLFQRMQEGTTKDLNLIVKGDVQGSVEVLKDTLGRLSGEQVRINVLHSSVGAVSTNDVLLASASDAIIIGFNVRPERNATELADKEGVDIRLHTIIYQLIDEIRLAMTGLLEPTLHEVFQGRAEVRNTFKVPKAGSIAGCYVTEGVIPRSSTVRLLRDNKVVYEGKIQSLRHFKNDVAEVRAGFECGIAIEKFQDVKVGDVIEAFKVEKIAGVLQ
jgi:translation initiation factor IF-2